MFIRACVIFSNMLVRLGEESEPRPTPKLEGHPVMAVHIRTYPPYLYVFSSVRNLRTRRGVLAGHIHRLGRSTDYTDKHLFLLRPTSTNVANKTCRFQQNR
jgi:hypothetical protein